MYLLVRFWLWVNWKPSTKCCWMFYNNSSSEEDVKRCEKSDSMWKVSPPQAAKRENRRSSWVKASFIVVCTKCYPCFWVLFSDWSKYVCSYESFGAFLGIKRVVNLSEYDQFEKLERDNHQEAHLPLASSTSYLSTSRIPKACKYLALSVERSLPKCT